MNDIEPFIISTVKDNQDIIFFANKAVKQDFNDLKSVVYKEIPNKIVQDNLVKIVRCKKKIIIVHIYPTNFKEYISNRKGQNLVIGYIINDKILIKKFDNLLKAVKIFFDAVHYCSYIENSTESVPTNFLTKINKEHYNDYIINVLTEKRIEMNNILKVSNKEYSIISDIAMNRLRTMYKFIEQKKLIYNSYWILVNKDNYQYYKELSQVYKLEL